jgi:sporulation protein YlmC with PRC-barrel domain
MRATAIRTASPIAAASAVALIAGSLGVPGSAIAQEPPATQEPQAPAAPDTAPPAAAPKPPPQAGADPAQQAIPTTSQTWSAKRLIDRDVYNAQGQEVGEIEDLLIDNDGKIAGVVVSVGGGFLGLGDREVAIAFKDLSIRRDNDGRPAVTTSLSQQALETSPEAPGRR